MRKKGKWIPENDYGFIFTQVPRLCVDLAVKTNKGILLSLRDIPPDKGKWHLPGGAVLFGETLKQAIKRIAKEETGLRVKIRKIVGVAEMTNEPFSSKGKFRHSVSIVHLVSPAGGKLKGSWQAKHLRFFKKIPPNTARVHERFLKEHRLFSRP